MRSLQNRLLQELIQFRDANAGKFAFIMMSLDHSREDQLAYLKKSAMNAPAVVFDDPVTNRLMQQRRHGFLEHA